MPDAVQYIKLTWDAILDGTRKNAFNKSKVLTLRGGADEEVDLMADLLCNFKVLNIPIDESTIEEFVPIDDKNNEMFSKKILNDINEMFETMQATNDNSEDKNDHALAKAFSQFPELAVDNVNFGGLEFMYKKSP